MSDLIEGKITPSVGNATCNAGGKLLKVVEMRYKYGSSVEGGQGKHLVLAIEDDKPALATGDRAPTLPARRSTDHATM